ncbi:MAG: hypothetical protein UU47_C0020G0007 [candidate division TM6 bacterium GW2011_GWE2_41_16]|nr:MAG: hypothetical protein UU47_C0020G0007 [candidate division TM6 bacterium GW2011_GWE2_41_16]
MKNPYRKSKSTFATIGCALTLLCSTLSIKPTTKQSPEWITIFVHGTFGLWYAADFDTFSAVVRDCISHSRYQINTLTLRNNPIFYHNQAMDVMGLKHISPEDILSDENGSALTAHLYHEVTAASRDKKESVAYYTFGWSGLLSSSKRFVEAGIFYQELSAELKKYKKRPKIRIIGYSHGGNIALNLAAVAPKENSAFTVDELILLGTPIQPVNDYLVTNPLFKSVYLCYSRNDMIQIIDCFSGSRKFSCRTFGCCSRYCLPPNLTQIELQVALPRPKPNFPRLNPNPGHIELWHFNWLQDFCSWYRGGFPLNPLPMVIFLPAIIQAAHEHEAVYGEKYARHMVARIDTQKETLTIHTANSCKKSTQCYITEKLVQKLKDFANAYKTEHHFD